MDSESFWGWAGYERISGVCNSILTIAARNPKKGERQGISASNKPGLDSGRLERDGRRTGILASIGSNGTGLVSGRLSPRDANTEEGSSAEIRRWQVAVQHSNVDSTQLRTQSPAGPTNYKQQMDQERQIMEANYKEQFERDRQAMTVSYKQQLDRERQIMERERQQYLKTIHELREKLDKEVQLGKALTRVVTEAHDETEKYAGQCRALRRELEDVEKEKTYQEDVRTENLEQEVKAAKFRTKNLGKIVTEAHKEVEKLVDENRALRNERKSVDEEINSLRVAKQKYERREKDYTNETTVLRDRVAQFENEASRLKSINSSVTQDNNRLTEENAKFINAIQRASQALELCPLQKVNVFRAENVPLTADTDRHQALPLALPLLNLKPTVS
jgi:chromosome segregation ATPase